jgi:hypothetical protein
MHFVGLSYIILHILFDIQRVPRAMSETILPSVSFLKNLVNIQGAFKLSEDFVTP